MGRTAEEGTAVAAEPVGTDRPVECAYCGRRFADGDLLALHRGFEHPAAIDDEERAAFETAYAAEDEDLRLFRLKALLALIVLYFTLLFAYSVFG